MRVPIFNIYFYIDSMRKWYYSRNTLHTECFIYYSQQIPQKMARVKRKSTGWEEKKLIIIIFLKVI